MMDKKQLRKELSNKFLQTAQAKQIKILGYQTYLVKWRNFVMGTNEKLIALIFDKDNLLNYKLENIDEIMAINIFEDLGYDSIQFIELIVKIETEFEIEIDEQVLFMENLSTIAKIADIVNERYVKKGGLGDE